MVLVVGATGLVGSEVCRRLISTVSRQAGDSIESVDLAGQLNLVNTAKAAGVDRFVSVCPADGKAQVENTVASLNLTVIRLASTDRGASPIGWVPFRDVAEIRALALRSRAAERTILADRKALSPLEVVARIEKVGAA